MFHILVKENLSTINKSKGLGLVESSGFSVRSLAQLKTSSKYPKPNRCINHKGNMSLSQLLKPSSLEIHPIDEVVRFLRCNGPSFLKFLFHQAQPASDHEQQQHSDGQTQGQGQHCTCEQVGGKGQVIKNSNSYNLPVIRIL